MAIYGYARVSTRTQKLERQLNNLNQYGVDKLYSEKFTGVKSSDDRKEWNKLLKVLQVGDTVVFDSVSRMSRSEDGVQTYFKLVEQGINLVFLKEPQINSDVYGEQLTNSKSISVDDKTLDTTIVQGIRDYLVVIAKKQISLAFEQSAKEAADIKQRVKEGLDNSDKKAGRKRGIEAVNKLDVPTEKILKHSNLFNGNLNKSELAKMLGVSRPTLNKWFLQLKGE